MDGLLENKELLIFDFDGVLFESHDANILFFNHCLEKAGYGPLQEDGLEKVVYMSTRQLIYEMIRDPKEARRVFDITQNTDYSPFIRFLSPLFDLEHTLGKLKKKYHLALASNRGASIMKLSAHYSLPDYFSYIVSTLEARPKPDPDMLIRCVDRFQLGKNRALYCGDARSDHEAAQAAGVDFLWVGQGQERPRIGAVDELLDYMA